MVSEVGAVSFRYKVKSFRPMAVSRRKSIVPVPLHATSCVPVLSSLSFSKISATPVFSLLETPFIYIFHTGCCRIFDFRISVRHLRLHLVKRCGHRDTVHRHVDPVRRNQPYITIDSRSRIPACTAVTALHFYGNDIFCREMVLSL